MIVVQSCLEFIDADKAVKEDITIGTNTSIEWDITIKENLCCGMKPYSGRVGGHNAGYHSANGMVGMIHRITRLIELVPPPEKFLGKRSPAEQTKIHRASLSRGILVTIYVWPPLSSCWLSCFPINMNECQLTNKSIFCNEPISFFLCVFVLF